MTRTVALVLTCEHGGAAVPREWRGVLDPARARRAGHRGYDAGALAGARALARALAAPLVPATTTRLLIDLNRSPRNPRRFSATTAALPPALRARLDAELLAPHRARVDATLEQALASADAVVHVAVHSFVPHLHGRVRDFDIGLLYDPGRAWERRLGTQWAARLADDAAIAGVRRNAPYRGVDDGIMCSIRRRYADGTYAGIELELNQRRLRGARFPAALITAVARSLRSVLETERAR